MTSSAEEVGTLTAWAVRLDRAERDRLLLALVNLLGSKTPGPRSRALFTSVLPALAEGADAEVRRELLLRLEPASWAPDALLRALVEDADHGVRLSLARLPALSEDAADALLADSDPEVQLALASNGRARLSLAALDALVEDSRRSAALRAPLARRRDLTAAQAQRLAAWSSPPLRRALAARFGLQAEVSAEPEFAPESARKLVDKLDRSGRLTRSFALGALRRGRLGVFEEAMAALGGVPAEALRAASQAEDPAPLALACAAAGVDRSIFPEVLREVRAANDGRPSDSPGAASAVIAALERPPAEAADALRSGIRPPRRPLDGSVTLRLAFSASDRPEAREARQRLHARYGGCDEADADVIVALGGDGFMLEMLHRHLDSGKPIYGMNRGSVGFLMNDYVEDDLPERIAAAERAGIHPLVMTATDRNAERHRALAINEVSLLRETHQTAKLRILIDGKVRMQELVCDGALVATPAGSTAYNFSAHGPIIPLSAQVLALTPISAFRPRRWRGALLPHEARVTFQILEADKRPVSAVADNFEVRDVSEVEICEDRGTELQMLFDAGRSLDERVLAEQFSA